MAVKVGADIASENIAAVYLVYAAPIWNIQSKSESQIIGIKTTVSADRQE